MHEGTDTVKKTKIQNLTSSFETLCMTETESFHDFYAIAEKKIVKKILQSLLERFHANVLAIEEHTNLNILRVEELVGNL